MTAAPSARRLSALVLVGVGAISLSSCGMGARQSGAAVVDGTVISNEDVDRVISDVKQAGVQTPTAQEVLTLLVIAPYVEKQAKATNKWTQQGSYQQLMQRVPNAGEPTKRLFTMLSILTNQGSNAFTKQDFTAVRQQVTSADIQINPRYGELKQTDNLAVPVLVGQATPKWIDGSGTPTTPAVPNGSQGGSPDGSQGGTPDGSQGGNPGVSPGNPGNAPNAPVAP